MATPRCSRCRVAGCVVAVLAGPAFAIGARADDTEPAGRHFYKGYDYGSQALYNPIYVLVNRGWDALQLAPYDRNPFAQNYLRNLRNVGGNVVDPFRAIAADGTWKFTREEILPLTWTSAGARWMPNYGLHLIGGGQTYAELREWYMDHEAPAAAATVFSIATLYTAAFINEAIENADIIGFNTDCLADLYVFDLGGILLFSIEPIRELFSKYIIVSDWSLQPSFTFPHGDIHNQGNYYAAKFALPFYERLGLFGYMGFSSMGGLSYKLDREYSITAAAGGKVSHIDNTSKQAVLNVVNVKSAAAFFLDRNESLLASLHVSDVSDYFIQANIYPNAFFHLDPGIGFWTVVAKDGRWAAGLSLTTTFGLGVGVSTL